jgi:hypothetical protein
MNEQHQLALAERRMRTISQASRTCGYPVNFQQHIFNIGIQVSNQSDLENFMKLSSSNLIDTISEDVLISSLVDLIMISDHLFAKVTEHYHDHDIKINVMFFDHMVLSTDYNFNNPPF